MEDETIQIRGWQNQQIEFTSNNQHKIIKNNKVKQKQSKLKKISKADLVDSCPKLMKPSRTLPFINKITQNNEISNPNQSQIKPKLFNTYKRSKQVRSQANLQKFKIRMQNLIDTQNKQWKRLNDYEGNQIQKPEEKSSKTIKLSNIQLMKIIANQYKNTTRNQSLHNSNNNSVQQISKDMIKQKGRKFIVPKQPIRTSINGNDMNIILQKKQNQSNALNSSNALNPSNILNPSNSSNAGNGSNGANPSNPSSIRIKQNSSYKIQKNQIQQKSPLNKSKKLMQKYRQIITGLQQKTRLSSNLDDSLLAQSVNSPLNHQDLVRRKIRQQSKSWFQNIPIKQKIDAQRLNKPIKKWDQVLKGVENIQKNFNALKYTKKHSISNLFTPINQQQPNHIQQRQISKAPYIDKKSTQSDSLYKLRVPQKRLLINLQKKGAKYAQHFLPKQKHNKTLIFRQKRIVHRHKTTKQQQKISVNQFNDQFLFTNRKDNTNRRSANIN